MFQKMLLQRSNDVKLLSFVKICIAELVGGKLLKKRCHLVHFYCFQVCFSNTSEPLKRFCKNFQIVYLNQENDTVFVYILKSCHLSGKLKLFLYTNN